MNKIMALSYTNSGNLSSDSRWNYAWNDRQRLASVETSQRAVSAGAPKVKYVYSYNWKGLKTKAEKYTWDTANSSWTLYCTNHRYYDDHNLIYERTVYASGVRDIYGNQMPETCNKYYYGIDLTGNVYASGGTGGIRMMNLNGKVAYPYNNATGNIEALFDDNGSLLAEYEYSPFGSIRCIRGSFADKNPMRFSSRYSEADTGLYYYSYRHYSPSLKKWLSHDPIGEQGSINLYNFVDNNPVLYVDILGALSFRWHGNWGGPGWTGGQWGSWEDLPEDYRKKYDKELPPIQDPNKDPNRDPNRDPKDERDMCYFKHDRCYGHCRMDPCNKKSENNLFLCYKGCDEALFECLSDYKQTHHMTFFERMILEMELKLFKNYIPAKICSKLDTL